MTNQQYADEKKKHLVISNGLQGAYGIGEIISTHRTRVAANKKARLWYNWADVVSPSEWEA